MLHVERPLPPVGLEWVDPQWRKKKILDANGIEFVLGMGDAQFVPYVIVKKKDMCITVFSTSPSYAQAIGSQKV